MRIYLLRTNYFNVHLSVEKNILLLFLQLNFKYLINNLQTQMEKWRQPHSQGSGTLQKPSHKWTVPRKQREENGKLANGNCLLTGKIKIKKL